MDVLGQLPSKLVNPFKQFVLDDAISRLNRIYLFVICILAGVIINVKDYAGLKRRSEIAILYHTIYLTGSINRGRNAVGI